MPSLRVIDTSFGNLRAAIEATSPPVIDPRIYSSDIEFAEAHLQTLVNSFCDYAGDLVSEVAAATPGGAVSHAEIMEDIGLIRDTIAETLIVRLRLCRDRAEDDELEYPLRAAE